MKKKYVLFILLPLCLLIIPVSLRAYIGPGAGFAFLSSFLVFFLTFLLAIFSLLSWPFRFFFRLIRGRKSYKKSSVDQVVIVGLDGMEPTLVEKYLEEGKLPNLSKLKTSGTYKRLGTTIPAISPVAWSSFMTGCHPAKHNIFDFLSRNPSTYLPDLSSAQISNPKKFLSLGKYKIPLSKPVIKGLRKSIPFWKTLGQNGIFSTILRIPITFPPEKFYGHLISGMCAPDLKGSQGTFSFYSSEKTDVDEGGMVIPVDVKNGQIETYISGPQNSLHKNEEEIHLPMKILINKSNDSVAIKTSGKTFHLKKNELSDWIKITFKPGLGMKIRAICRFYVSEISPKFKMYMTPLNIDPEKPSLPISHPFIYSVYLAKLLGPYNTLGEADDTWALNEGVIDEDTFLKLCYDNHKESEDMLFNAMKKTRRGVIACWFQVTDSIQHMFFRYLDKKHPALKHARSEKSEKVIEDLYTKMDDLVGRVIEKLNKNSCLIVMSDHGFKQFKRGVNINSWLYKNGFLSLKKGKNTSGEWFKDVDWERTKAYGLGLGGIYINVKGREEKGIVDPGREYTALKSELKTKLESLRDEKENQNAIRTIYDRDKIPSGPYKDNCPDLIVGYHNGYRVSWDSVTGKVDSHTFQDNIKAWSGDHCIDPEIVPGVLFCNRKIGQKKASIVDIAPTVLKLFGIKPPAHMDGTSLL
ncbi:MAG: alkaline phosphatase family protein [Candidatus Aminicenantes bacterium]|nr:alkaline phosphatase family protein [Candidatus Aminicenantes bacterium]